MYGRLRLVQLNGELQIFDAQVREQIGKPGGVARRAGVTLNQPDADRVADWSKYDRYRRGVALGCGRGAGACGNQKLRTAGNQRADRSREFRLVADPYDVKDNVPVLNQANVAQPLSEHLDERLVIGVGGRTERQKNNPDRSFCRLGMRGERVGNHHDANQAHQRATEHSTTLWVRVSIDRRSVESRASSCSLCP